MNKAAAFVLVLAAALLASPWRGHIDDVDAQLYQCLARGMAERHAWLDPLRMRHDFDAILDRAEHRHLEARADFVKIGGETLLGIGS